MGRAKADLEQIKLNRRSRNERYRANRAVMERNREKNTLYQRKKREQARLRLHPDPLAQLADVATQQQYLQDTSEALAEPEPVEEERELMVDVGIAVEEDGEILEGFAGLSGGGYEEDWGFNDGGGFPDEPESDNDSGNGGDFNGGFPDEPESDTNSDTDDGFLNEPEAHDDGS